MMVQRNPGEAYRRIDFDARVAGADPQALVVLCYETVVTALGSALFCHDRADNRGKSAAITRAISAITALQLGLREEGSVSAALQQFLEAGRRGLLDAALAFDPAAVGAIRRDFSEIAQAMAQASRSRVA